VVVEAAANDGTVDVRGPLSEKLRIAEAKSAANTVKQEEAKAEEAAVKQMKQELDKKDISGPTPQSLRADAEDTKSKARAKADEMRRAAQAIEDQAQRDADDLVAEAKRKEKIVGDKAAVAVRLQNALHEVEQTKARGEKLKKEATDCRASLSKLDESERRFSAARDEAKALLTSKKHDNDDDDDDDDDDDGAGAVSPPSKRPRSESP